MTKMAAMPIYMVKTLHKSPKPEGRWPSNLVYSISDYTDPVAQLVECSLRGMGGHRFIRGRNIPKSLKMVLAAPRLTLRLAGESLDWSAQYQDNVTGCCIMSSVGGMILQWGSTKKVSTEFLVATRHRCDMTEKILKTMWNPNKTNKQKHLTWWGPTMFDQMMILGWPWTTLQQGCVNKNNCIQDKITTYWVFISNIKTINHIDKRPVYLLNFQTNASFTKTKRYLHIFSMCFTFS